MCLSKRIESFLAFVAVVCTAPSLAQAAGPFGSAFTYQGQLKLSGVPVSETCDFVFTLWDDPVAILVGNQVGPTLIFDGGVGNSAPIEVVNGLFELALDFGSNVFTGDGRWLEIDVCCLSPCAPNFTTLNPRQELTPTPYALALPALRTVASTNEKYPDSPNVIGGHRQNSVGDPLAGATISGGGVLDFPNSVTADFGTVGGGANNIAGLGDTVGGGINNEASGHRSSVSGGKARDVDPGRSWASGDCAFVAA